MLIKPIAVENCGFSTAEVNPDAVCACHDMRGHFKNFFREMIDTVGKTASTGNENAGTEIIDE